MLGKKNGQRRMREAVIAFIVFVGLLAIPLVYIWFAGYDCEAPDDSDLAVQEEVNWGPEQEREFAAFTNVLVRVVSFPFVRYLCQPNRTKAYLCAQIRNEMELFRTGHCVRPNDKQIHSWHRIPSWHIFVDREWLGKDVTLDLAADKIHIGGCKVEELRIGEPKDR